MSQGAVTEYLLHLFAALCRLDGLGLDGVVVEPVPESGLRPGDHGPVAPGRSPRLRQQGLPQGAASAWRERVSCALVLRLCAQRFIAI